MPWLRFVPPKLPIFVSEERSECGLVAIAMIASFYHRRTLELAKLRTRYRTSSRGARLGDLIDVAKALKLEPRPFRAGPEGLPLLKLPALLHWRGNHFVVLARLTSRRAVLHDPSGGRKVISRERLVEGYSGVAVEFERTGDLPDDVWSSARRIPPERRFRLGRAAACVSASVIEAGLAYAAWTLAVRSIHFTSVPAAEAGRTPVSLLPWGALVLALIGARTTLILILAGRMTAQATPSVVEAAIGMSPAVADKFDRATLSQQYSPAPALFTHLHASLLLGAASSGGAAVGLLLQAAISVWAMVAGLAAALAAVAFEAVVGARMRRSLRPQRRGVSAAALLRSGIQFGRTIFALGLSGAMRRSWREAYLAEHREILGKELRRASSLVVRSAAGLFVLMFQLALIRLEGLPPLDRAALLLAAGLFFWRAFVGADHFAKAAELSRQAAMLRRASLDAPMEVEADRGDYTGTVEFTDVTFGYGLSDDGLLANVNFTIQPGQLVVIVGPSGAGKSTLAQLLLGLRTPTAGSVKICGRELAGDGWDSWRRSVGYAAADDPIVAGTLAENIALFDLEPDLKRVTAAADQAGLAKLVERLPMKLETIVAEGGPDLSSGERQRLLLARAIYRARTALIIDGIATDLRAVGESPHARADAPTMTRIVVDPTREVEDEADLTLHVSDGAVHVIASPRQTQLAS